MGSSGMKRKGRKHLPKAGTRPSDEMAVHDRRDEALHPFSSDPGRRRGTGGVILGVIAVAAIVIAVLAFILAT